MATTWVRGRDGYSWLPVRQILWAPTNQAHYNHLHVEGYPKASGSCTSTRTAAIRQIIAALDEFFPGWKSLGVYNCRKIAGTNTWSQHAFSNAVDVGPYYGVAQQKRFFDMLTAPTKPEGGEDVKEVYARLQASLIRAGYDLGDFAPYLPAGDEDSLPGADGSWGPASRAAQDAANKASAGTVDSTARRAANLANTRLDKLHSV